MITNLLLLALLGTAVMTLYAVWKTYLRIEHSVLQNSQQMRALFNELKAYHELTKLLQLEAPLPAMRGWAASPDFLLHVVSHALASRPATIVECSSGVSTIVLARCCELNGRGHVYSLEHDGHYAGITRDNIAAHGLEKWATVLDAPIVPSAKAGGQPWYSTHELDSIPGRADLLVVDGPPGTISRLARYPALPVLMPRLADSCAVFMDDALRPDERATVDRWLHEFPEFEAHELTAEKGCVLLQRRRGDAFTALRDAS
ncbi:MAG TPA: class I SAM-dependent methyltransferase [Gemmatimonadales bacterium]|nr:class I SAM-dependent methyltransferase [Gemmatimonadales bacterium]